ncbi:MAG: hypothetical protein ACTHM2_06460 [Afipia sp.]
MALGGTYSTGTVSTDGGDAKKLVFSGTLLSSVVTEGDVFMASGLLGRIDSVDDDTHITLNQDWPGGTLTDASYLIDKTSYARYDPAITQAKIREFIAYIKGQGSFLFVTGASPDPAMGEDGQYALKTNGGPWQLWYKTGGVWEAQGIRSALRFAVNGTARPNISPTTRSAIRVRHGARSPAARTSRRAPTKKPGHCRRRRARTASTAARCRLRRCSAHRRPMPTLATGCCVSTMRRNRARPSSAPTIWTRTGTRLTT